MVLKTSVNWMFCVLVLMSSIKHGYFRCGQNVLSWVITVSHLSPKKPYEYSIFKNCNENQYNIFLFLRGKTRELPSCIGLLFLKIKLLH
uniref:Secreted protein n=1 Tax=Anguilla anguilla TaxID=7936 RepID=A0A0E9X673_ANGAN